MSFSEAEVETILDELRRGATVQSGGSRCHTTWFYRGGVWGWEDFDEGHTTESTTDEATIRRLIASEPGLFEAVLAGPHRKRFSTAFLAGEREVAREALRSALAYGDPLDHGKVLAAILAWPESAPSDAVVQLLRTKLHDLTAYHVFMGAVGWDRSPAVGAKGVEFSDQVIAMVGDAPGCWYLRSTFHEQAGDLAAAERDMAAELARTPAGEWHQGVFAEQLERLRGLASLRGLAREERE